MKRLYHYLVGYLKVTLKGENCEKILNAAARERISFNALNYRKGKIEGKVTVSDFRRLRYCVRKTDARVHIISKHGLPFIVNRHRHRIGFFSGALLFVAILYTLSLFVWNIEVTGNHKTDDKTILSACDELGIKIGAYKNGIDNKIDAQRLLLCSKDLAWASITIEGSCLTVNVSEIKNQQNEEREPCNLVAAEDGIITRIDVTEGNTIVSVSDVVKKGDLLVSGIFERLSETEFVASQGTVEATVDKTFTASADYVQKVFKSTEKVRSHSVLSLFWLNIPLYVGRIEGDYISETVRKDLKLFDRTLPISITTKRCVETEKIEVKYNDEQLKSMLKKDIEEQMKSAGITEYTVKSEGFSNTDSSIVLTVVITTNENIAIKEKILMGTN